MKAPSGGSWWWEGVWVQCTESQGNSFPSKPTRLQQNPAAGTDRHDPCSVEFQGFHPSHAGFSPPKSHVWGLLCLSMLLAQQQPLGRNSGAIGCALGSHWNFVWPTSHSMPVSEGATCVSLSVLSSRDSGDDIELVSCAQGACLPGRTTSSSCEFLNDGKELHLGKSGSPSEL